MKKSYLIDAIVYIFLKVLFIILILLLILYLVMPKIMCRPLRAEKTAAVIQIELLKTALDIFRLDVGRYPSTQEGLNAVIFRPNDVNENVWKGPYLPKNKLPKDPWGNEFNYIFDANKDRFLIYSYGKDGVSKSNGNDYDDINNWDETHKWEKYYHKNPSDRVLWVLIILIIINAYLLRKQKKKLIHNQEAQVDSKGTRVLRNRGG